MKIQRIAVAVDFSDYDLHTVALAAALARDNQATLLIVHVHESPMAYGGEFYQGELNPSLFKIREMFEAIVPLDDSVAYEHHLIQAEGKASREDTDVARAIASFAELNDVDLIVTSTHGRTGLKRMLMGSVAQRVIREASCPVLTMKHRTPGSS